MTPFRQRNACSTSLPGKSAAPTTSPASLIQTAVELSPPKLPRSCITPCPKKSVATWPSDLLRARPWVICQTRSVNDLTSVVRAYRCSIASEAAEVDHGAVLPKERVIGE